MSRDKYSNDHSIEITNGSGTLTIDGDLVVSGDLILESISLSEPVLHTQRFLGVAFNPADITGASALDYNSTLGSVIFTGSSASVVCGVYNLPHGATIQSIKPVGVATGASDSISIYLRRSDGDSVTNIASASYSNESFDAVVPLPTPVVVDYTNDFGFFILAAGSMATTETILFRVDVNYTLQTFPLDSSITIA